MKHCINNKIILFFAYTKKILNPNEMQSIKETHQHLNITESHFDRSCEILKDTLQDFKVDPILIEETLTFYQTMKKEIATKSDPPPLKHDSPLNQSNNELDKELTVKLNDMEGHK